MRRESGSSFPIGATVTPGGVNFSVYSRSASWLELVLFEREDEAEPAGTIALSPAANRTSHYWHVFVEGLRSGQLYGYRAHGPFYPAGGIEHGIASKSGNPIGVSTPTTRRCW